MYNIQLRDFEGPLDLLLFFIQRDEIDIFDIPIAKITDEYLQYVRLMDEVDLDGVADFIYMAALLIHVKVRMLLPKPEVNEEGEIIDPRQDLVERLLAYMRYKEAAEGLDVLHKKRGSLFTRGKASAPEIDRDVVDTLVNTTVFQLVSAFGRVLAEACDAPTLAVEDVEYKVADQRAFIAEALGRQEKALFGELVQNAPKRFVITTFLAVLEMAQQGLVWLALTPEADDFYVRRLSDSLQNGDLRLN